MEDKIDLDQIRSIFKGLIDEPIILDIDKEVEELKIPEDDLKF